MEWFKGNHINGSFLMDCWYELEEATPTSRVLSSKPIGAPIYKIRGWGNSQLTLDGSSSQAVESGEPLTTPKVDQFM